MPRIHNHEEMKKQFLSLLSQTSEPCDEQCTLVLDFFFSIDGHHSAVDVATSLGKRGYAISPKKVENILEKFVQYGIASQLTTDSGTLYEHLHIDEHHDHLICTKCGKIIELTNYELERFQKEVTLKKNFFPFYHKLQIYGICQECVGGRKTLMPLSYTSIGEEVLIDSVMGGVHIQKRLEDMGLVKGTKVKVLNNAGSYILQLGESRLAIGRGMAHKIMVTPQL